MTKAEFKRLTGESPEDFFGPDWENYMAEFEQNLRNNRPEAFKVLKRSVK